MLMQYLYIGGYRMSEFSDIMTRVKLDNIIGYLIYGIEDYEMKKRGTYEERIEDAFDRIFKSIERICPFLNRQNDELQSAIIDFSVVHKQVYLEMGIIIGIQMYQNLEKQYIDLSNVKAIIERNMFADIKKKENKQIRLGKVIF